jgi:sugar lactone lactonase YvrE
VSDRPAATAEDRDFGAAFTRIGSGYGLVTALAWDHRVNELYAADAADGGVWVIHPQDRKRVLVAHRKGIGGVVLHADGGCVVSGRNVSWKVGDWTQVLLELDDVWQLTRFNDLTADSLGRVYVGSLDFDPASRDQRPTPGYLHLIDLDGTCTILDDGIGTANGLVISPSGGTLYFVDTYEQVVWQYDLQPATGRISNKRVFYRHGAGELDGLSLTADGYVVVAVGEPADCIAVVDPAGDVSETFHVPAPHVTSACFSGTPGELFVGAAHEVWQLKTELTGHPRPMVRVLVNAADPPEARS